MNVLKCNAYTDFVNACIREVYFNGTIMYEVVYGIYTSYTLMVPYTFPD